MHVRLLTGLPLAIATLAACSQPAAPPPPGPDPAAVRAAVDSQFGKLSAAYRALDGTAFAAVYATDAVSSSPNGALTGRPAIEAVMKKRFANVVSTASDTATTEDLVISGDRAVQSGHVTWTETDKGKKPMKMRVDFVFTWHKDADGAWRIQRDLDYQTMTPAK